MKIAVDQLTGRALTWAFIRALGHAPHVGAISVAYRTDHGSWDHPTLSEREAVELMNEHWIGVERPSKGQTPPQWRALADVPSSSKLPDRVVSAFAPSLAIAVHRCFIKSRMGDVVDIPDELTAAEAAA